MNDLPTSSLRDAATLLERWDAQQTAYIKHRAMRFDVVAETIARLRGRAPRILDLACGPGSMIAALAIALPDAKIVGVDKDPVLVALASEIFTENKNIDIIEADLDAADWHGGISGQFDAITSSTALHWLAPDILGRLYFQLPQHLATGGLFLNADHLYYDEIAQPTLNTLARQDDEANQVLAFANGADTWDAWWLLAEQRYPDAKVRRDALWDGKVPPLKVTLGYHLETLRSAGFKETGTIWQYLDDFVICAVK